MSSSIYCSKSILLRMAVAVLIIHSVSSFECSPSHGKIECECSATMAECFGVQTNVSEIQEILANFSFASNIILKINDLQFDPDFVFENSSIHNLTLGYDLQTLSPIVFSELSSSLVSLNLQNNSIKEIDGIFSSLNILEELFLDINEIHELKSSDFINLNNLKHLSLSRNDIHEVSPDVFQNLSSLQELVLSYNNISLLENINLKSTSLNVLKIDNCLIEGSLNKDAFSYLPNLEQLDLSYNNLSQIEPHSLSGLKNLRYLNASYNVLNKLHENAFSEVTNLTLLDLRGNQIQIFSVTSFAKLYNLIYLDLSGNKLNAVLCEYTIDFASLEEIYLQDNEIKSFSSGAFFYSPNLKVLDIAGNNLECSCSLTDTAHYLIENSTIESKDLESISCIIPSTRSPERITDYKSSKCTAPEPCKKSNKLLIGDDEYEDDYSDEENISSSTVHVTTTPLFTDKAFPADSTTTSMPTDTENSLSTVGNTTEMESTTVQQSTLLEENDTKSFIYTDNPTSVTDLANLTTSTEVFTEAVYSPETLFTVGNSTEMESTTVQQSTLLEENDTKPFIYTDNPTSATDLANLTTSTEVFTEAVYSPETVFTEISIYSENTTSTTRTIQISPKIETTTVSTKAINSTSTPKCFTMGLSVSNISSGSELEILKNFTYDGNTFCLKWTVGSISTIKRCIIKYLNINGTKIENIKCPTFKNEVVEWSVDKNIYTFCIIIYSNKKVDSCAAVSKKNTSSSSTSITVPLTTFSQNSSETEYSTTYSTLTSETFIPTTTNVSIPFESFISTINPKTTETLFTAVNSETTSEQFISTTNKMSKSSLSSVTLTGVISSTAETITAEDTEDKTLLLPNISSTTTSITRAVGFFITALNVYYNNSELVFITWLVNLEQPFHACNLTLISTTQQFDFDEGIFPCKNNTYRLRNVGENDLFKICIESQHEVSGKNRICRQSLSTAKASKSKEDTLNSSLIPLICLLILFGILVVYIALKNIFKKKKESYKYDVHAEEEKYQQRVKIRPFSSHDESVRFSYIAKENTELI